MREMFRRFIASPVSLAAFIFLAAMVLLALVGPLLSPFDPFELGEAPLAGPSWSHWFGTDELGRDLLTRVIYGARISLAIAAAGVAGSLVLGTIVGLAAGYFGGAVDAALSRVTDVMFALPDILLALVVMAVLGEGSDRIALAIAIVYVPIFARVCRGAVLSIAGRPYVEAARAAGAGHLRILTRHILPNIAGPLMVQTTLSLAFAVLAEAALSFLGLAGEAGTPSWGALLQQGKDYMQLAWWTAIFPGVAITLTVLSFNLLGDGLRDALTRE